MNWTLEDCDRVDDDHVLIEETPDYAIYLLTDFDSIGYGVMKEGKYWVKHLPTDDLSLDEMNGLDITLLTEAKQFANGTHPNKLALF